MTFQDELNLWRKPLKGEDGSVCGYERSYAKTASLLRVSYWTVVNWLTRGKKPLALSLETIRKRMEETK